MATESDLRDLLRGPDPEGPAIDIDAVLRRARSRRRPRVIAAQAIGSLALVAVVGVPAFITLPPAAETASVVAVEAAEDSDAAGGSEFQSAPVGPLQDLQRGHECGLPPVIPPLLGWGVEVLPMTADPATVSLSVTLSNDEAPLTASGTATVAGITVVADGVVVGHAFPDASTGPVDLAPSETVTMQAVAPYVACDGAPATLPVDGYGVAVDLQFLHGGTDGVTEPLWSDLVEVP